MALTKISTGGVKDDAVTADKIPADAVGQSEIADEAIDEARLQVSNAGTNGQFLQKQSGNTGGLTWATVTVPDSDKIEEGNTSVETVDTGSDGHVKITTEGTEKVRVIANGKVGIGLTSPETQLEVLGSVWTKRTTADQWGEQFRGRKDRAGSIVQNNDDVLTLLAQAYDGNNYRDVARIEYEIDGTPGAGDMPGRLVFQTTPDGSTSCTERLRISSAGALGIGGANYGTSGQVLTSGGSGAAPQWADASSGALGYDMWCVDAQFPAANGYYREWNYQQAWGSAQTFTNDGGSGAASGGPGPATMSISRCTTSQNPLFAKVGTGMSMTDGIWTFPNTGEWRVTFAPEATEKNTSGGGHNLYIWTTTDNGSNWHDAIRTYNRSHDSQWAGVPFNPTSLRLNITDTSNQKVKFSMGGGDGRTRVFGYSDRVASRFIFEQIS